MAGRIVVIAVLTALGFAACSAGAGRTGGAGDRITREQLEAVDVISTYDAILRLRPAWLQARGSFSIEGGTGLPRVHINDSRAATLDELRSLPSTNVESIQFLSAADATIRFGTGYPGGVIEVRTRR
jgi:hypothetical protein